MINCSVASGKFPKNSITLRFFTNSYISNISTYDRITYIPQCSECIHGLGIYICILRTTVAVSIYGRLVVKYNYGYIT